MAIGLPSRAVGGLLTANSYASGFDYSETDSKESEFALSLNSASAGSDAFGASSAWVKARYGVVRMRALAGVTGNELFPDDLHTAQSIAVGGWTDTFSVIPVDTSLWGRAATMRVSLNFEASGHNAGYFLDVTFGQNSSHFNGIWDEGPDVSAGTSPQEFFFDIGIVLGPQGGVFSRVQLEGFADVQGWLLNPGSASFLSDQSLSWGGILELRDFETDMLISDFSVQSESGTDWSQPIPAPSSVAVLLFGSAAVSGVRRRSIVT